jgi:hypothetical protein
MMTTTIALAIIVLKDMAALEAITISLTRLERLKKTKTTH